MGLTHLRYTCLEFSLDTVGLGLGQFAGRLLKHKALSREISEEEEFEGGRGRQYVVSP